MMMKILYHHRILSKDGQYVHIEELTSALRAAGHDLLIIGPRQVKSSSFGSDGGKVSDLKKILPRMVYEIIELLYSVPAMFRLSLAVYKFKPDFIYERYTLFFPAGTFVKRIFRVPMLLEINAPLCDERSKYDGLCLKKIASWSERFVWCNADYALPVSAALSTYLIKAGVSKEKISVIHNGINPENFQIRESIYDAKVRIGVAEDFVLGFVGFLRSWHGIDRVIRFIADEPDLKVRLVVVGSGPAKADLEELARKLNVSDRLMFTGIVQRRDIPRYINSFDIALQPAVVGYASPLKLFEYLAMGKAIVAPDTENISDIIVHEKNGILFNVNDEASFRESIKRLIFDSDLRDRLGKSAKETIFEQGLTWEKNAARVQFLALSIKNKSGIFRNNVN